MYTPNSLASVFVVCTPTPHVHSACNSQLHNAISLLEYYNIFCHVMTWQSSLNLSTKIQDHQLPPDSCPQVGSLPWHTYPVPSFLHDLCTHMEIMRMTRYDAPWQIWEVQHLMMLGFLFTSQSSIYSHTHEKTSCDHIQLIPRTPAPVHYQTTRNTKSTLSSHF